MNPLDWWLTLAVLLFCIGAYGVLARRNVILVIMSLELMLNAVNIALVAVGQLPRRRPRAPAPCSRCSSSRWPPPRSRSGWPS